MFLSFGKFRTYLPKLLELSLDFSPVAPGLWPEVYLELALTLCDCDYVLRELGVSSSPFSTLRIGVQAVSEGLNMITTCIQSQL
uniref:Putative ovule protein n=1 Tax=Solanum chacoense TaxID=4108 RepID=A0A0V0HDM4_SOLCH